jgi:NAD-dependent DNA ligase
MNPAIFKGKRVVLTGKIPGYARNEVVSKLNHLGASVGEAVSTADFVIATNDAIAKSTSKYMTAKKLKTSKQIISEQQILNILNNKANFK